MKQQPRTMDINEFYIGSADGWQIASALMTAVCENNHDIYNHSIQVAALAGIIAKAMGFPAADQNAVFYGAYLHDIGNIGIPDGLLAKPDKLTAAEYKIIQQHPTNGYHILKRLPVFGKQAEVVFCHHERYDGKGYPRGLAGKNIPVAAAVVSVAEAFEAMTGNRGYRDRFSMTGAVQEVQKCSGSQFDPAVVSAFSSLFNRGRRAGNRPG